MGIEDTVPMIDLRVPNVLVPIVGMTIPEATRIKPAKGIVGKEERTAEIHAKRQGDFVIVAAISKAGPSCKALMVDFRINGVPRRSCRQLSIAGTRCGGSRWRRIGSSCSTCS